uniref:Ig-like domain-containing protein n=1 Tax=Ciona intestinalis TaxID=7719 RepID=F6RYL0_CIOIN
MGEKENRKKSREKMEKDRKQSKEKREREIARFQAEIYPQYVIGRSFIKKKRKQLITSEDGPVEAPKNKTTKTFVPKLSGTVKGKFEALEKKKQEEARLKTETERKKRNERDSREKKRMQIELAKKKQMKEEGKSCDEEEEEDVKIIKSKSPGKINIDFQEEEKRRKERKSRKLEMEKMLRMKEEIRSMKQPVQNEESSDEEYHAQDSPTPAPKKLTTDFSKLLKEQENKQRSQIEEEKRRKLEEEKLAFRAARLAAGETDGVSSSSLQSQSSSPEVSRKKPNRLASSFTKFDVLEAQRFEEERKRIQEKRNALLEEERKMFEKTKAMMKECSDESLAALFNCETCQLNKSFTEFDKVERMRIKEERDSLFQEKARKLEEERRLFKEAREQMIKTPRTLRFEIKSCVFKDIKDDSDSADEVNSSMPCQPNKLPSTLTNFNVIEGQRLEKERIRLHEERIKQLENEIKIFEDQRKQNPIQRIDSVDDVTSATKELLQSAKNCPRPKKLASSFTKFDVVEKKRREEERKRLQEERARKLAEERRMFKESREQLNNQSDSEKEDSISCDAPIVGKMDIRGKIEAVVRAQEEAERKRIEETKFSRMTGEQQEMYLARQRQAEDSEEEDEGNDGSDAEENSAASESGCSNDSGEYSGYPYFVQTLSNLKVKEGDPVRFDAYINANPHPKVVWYFKGRVIRNCPDYQYMNKGTQYSLYMNESFVDDTGEFACKATNDKGTATSKAFLFVNDTVTY